MMLKIERAEVLLIASIMVFQGMLAVPLILSDQAGGSPDENRLPTGYLTVFHDDFQSGTLSPSRWAYWTGHWSTDNVAKTPTGGIYNGENYYLTESPYPNSHGAPLDDNGNEGIFYPDENAMIETVWIDLRNVSQPRLEFRHMYDIPSQGDGALVYIMPYTEREWNLQEPDDSYPRTTGWSGVALAWSDIVIRLDAYSGERIKLGFLFKSSRDGVEGDGWSIDDIEIGGRPDQMLSDLKFGSVRLYLDGYPVTTALAGDVLEINASIINDGRDHSGPFMVSAYTDYPLRGGVEIGEIIVKEGLGVGDSMYISMNWVALQGHYDLLLVLDRANKIPEQNELNNERLLTLDIDIPPGGDAVLVSVHFEEDGRPVMGAGIGDLVSIVAVVANYGSSDVNASMVVRAYDGDPDTGGEVVGDDEPSFNVLYPDRPKELRIPWRPPEGNHTIHVVVSHKEPDQIIDDNPENDRKSAPLVVTDSPSVDIVAETLLFEVGGSVSSAGFEGDNVHIYGTLGNQGTGAFDGIVEATLYIGDPDSGGRELARDLVVGVLEPGSSTTVEFDWRGELGTHALYLFVDPGNKLFEADETNNQLSHGLTITRRPLPDLVVDDMRFILNGVEVDISKGTNKGAEIEVNITIKNDGNVETQGITVTHLYLKNPALVTGAPSLLGSFEVPEGLNPDEVFTDSITWEANPLPQKGLVPVLYVIADAEDREPETDELNNFEMLPLLVGDPIPDLTVTQVSLRDAYDLPVDRITYGVPVTIKVVVKNVGTDISFQDAKLGFFVDSTEPENLVGEATAPTMVIGEEVVRSFTWTPDPDVHEGGSHDLIAMVDSDHKINEASDANNEGSATLYIDADAKPNLLVANLEVTSGGKVVDRLEEGQKAHVTLKVINLGDAPLYTSTNLELWHGDPVQGGTLVNQMLWELSSLPVGGVAQYDTDWTFDKEAPLVVVIDPNNWVKETNEGDNTATFPIKVEAPPEGANVLVIGAIIGAGVVLIVLITFLVVLRKPTEHAEKPMPTGEVPAQFTHGAEVVIEPPAALEAQVGVEEAPATETEITAEGPESEAEPETEAPEEPPVPAVAMEAEAEAPPEVSEPVEAPPEPAEEPAEPAPEEAPMPKDEFLPPPPEITKCPNCSEEIDPDWILCPFCDASLK
jgi:subtilase family serine protease